MLGYDGTYPVVGKRSVLARGDPLACASVRPVRSRLLGLVAIGGD